MSEQQFRAAPACYEFSAADSPARWHRCHAIREKELFLPERKIYNRKHAGDKKDGNRTFALWTRNRIIGTARLDLLDSPIVKTAAIRLLAIRRPYQGQGAGRYLMQTLEEFARNKDIDLLVLNARLTAVDFYIKLGYVECSWRDPGRLSGSLSMGKLLTPRIVGGL